MLKLFVTSFITFGLLGLYYKPVEIRERLIEVAPTPKPFEELLREGAKTYGIPIDLALAMVAQESEAAKAPNHALRFEPGQLSRGRAAAVKVGLKGSIDFEEQARAFASSHCPLQVMGLHAAEEGESWAVLHDPRNCVEYGLRYLAKCRERHSKKSPIDREMGALECYNGSTAYALKVLNRLGNRLLTRYLAG